MRARLFSLTLLSLLLVACGDDSGSADGGDGSTADMDSAAGCAAGETECGAACVDTQSDPANCGMCGMACGGGQVCDMGACADMCSGGRVDCGGACVDTQTSDAHCGMCDRSCAPTQTCTAGACVDAMCEADGMTCAANGDCCSGRCEGSTCAPAAMCAAVGAACGAAAECCSGQCNDAAGAACAGGGDCVCAPPAACLAEDAPCAADAECCNGLCDRPGGAATGQCASIGSCSTAGEPCSGDGLSGSCCSTVCLDTGSGPRCQFLGGCRVQDELCRTDAECCSGACRMNGMTSDGRPIMRCANVDSCLPPGEVCGDGGASSNCCPNGGGDTGCEPTGGGFRRCLGGERDCTLPGRPCVNTAECCMDAFPNIMCQAGPAGANVCCLSDGEDCAFGDVCCSGVCTPDPTDGVLRCGDMCVADGQACTVDADCCGCGCISDGMGGQVCTSDMTLCDPCVGPGLGEFCDPAGTPCCNAPAVTCQGTNEFATCQLAP